MQIDDTDGVPRFIEQRRLLEQQFLGLLAVGHIPAREQNRRDFVPAMPGNARARFDVADHFARQEQTVFDGFGGRLLDGLAQEIAEPLPVRRVHIVKDIQFRRYPARSEQPAKAGVRVKAVSAAVQQDDKIIDVFRDLLKLFAAFSQRFLSAPLCGLALGMQQGAPNGRIQPGGRILEHVIERALPQGLDGPFLADRAREEEKRRVRAPLERDVQRRQPIESRHGVIREDEIEILHLQGGLELSAPRHPRDATVRPFAQEHVRE